LIQTAEELLEMVGLVLLTFAILTLLQEKYGGFFFIIPGGRDASRADKSIE
jgi:hypothetical protein